MQVPVFVMVGSEVGTEVGRGVGEQPMLPELDVNISVVVASSGMVQHNSGQGAKVV